MSNYVIVLVEKSKEVATMSMIRWQPFSELLSLRQAMERLFEDSFVRPSRLFTVLGKEIGVAIDMYQTPDDVVVKATLPAVKPQEVESTISGDTLTIKGETKAEAEVKKEDYVYQERRYGSFRRSITLPSSLKTEKAEEVKPKQIKVTAKGVIEGKE